MAVRRVAGNEHPADLIALGDCNAQIPETDVFELGVELKSRRLVQHAEKVEVVARCFLRHRRVEEEPLAHVDPSEELPIALQVGMHGPIGRALRITLLETLVEFSRAEYDQHHQLVEVGADPGNPDLLAHDGMAAIAADHVVRLDDFADAIFCNGDPRLACVLFDRGGSPAEARLDTRQGRHLRAQHLFHLILRQTIVLLEIVVVHQQASSRRVIIRAVQITISGDLADGETGRHHPGGAQLIDDTHEVEMLESTMGEILAFRNAA